MDKLQLTGRYLDPVFNSGRGSAYVMNLYYYEVKQTNLQVENSGQSTFRLSPVISSFPGAPLLSYNKLG
jgi:hypothetical protein